MIINYKRISALLHPEPEFMRQVLKEMLHTGIALMTVSIVIIWLTMCQGWSDMRWARWRKHGERRTVPLNDMVLGRLSYMDGRNTWVSDALVNSAGIICLLGNILMARGWRARLIVFRRIAWFLSIIYFLRSITMSVTTIPPPITNCVPIVIQDANDMLRVISDVLSGRTKGCTDMVFSGHTAVCVVSFLFWVKYARHWSFIVYSAIHTVVGISSVLLVRYHYTLDVLLAIMMTFFVDFVYYRSLDSAVRQRLAADRCTRYIAVFGKDAFATSAKNRGTGFVYSRVASEDNKEFTHSNTGPDAINNSPARAGQDAKIVELERAYSSAFTLNTPVQEPKTAFPETLIGPDDIEKALGTSLAQEQFYTTGLVHDEDSNTYHQDMLLINRPLSKCLSTVVAWMDGLHLR
ncbi:hypothetical protein BX661DRAFT_176663 [Kickxella alabastrina]|uniref:uncharacterized protein n=1 Tax=Kickxella alabastrina TaxID=61397 RepID=UPI00222053EB|nr:uncharacterized protein BX661DRAFT_176663 [Kickxella alabastrina]KAI7834117.1 hypothetical protein BX661DRAFT_176663 [Kickxella alabastrina]KAJ1945828.1 hypothetical protein GGF37_001498 [Kickxella alabastrina]